MAGVRGLRFGRRVEVDVHDVVQHPHGGLDGFGQQRFVEAVGVGVGPEVQGTQVADGGFFGAGVQEDFGAEV